MNLCNTPCRESMFQTRLHLLSYHNSTNHNSGTLVHVMLSPPFHTKKIKLCATDYGREKKHHILACIVWILKKRYRTLLSMCLYFFFLASSLSFKKAPCGVGDKHSYVCIQCLSQNPVCVSSRQNKHVKAFFIKHLLNIVFKLYCLHLCLYWPWVFLFLSLCF